MKTLLLMSCFLSLTLFFSCDKNKTAVNPDNKKNYLSKVINANGTTTFAYNDQMQVVSRTFTSVSSPSSPSKTSYSNFNSLGFPAQSATTYDGRIAGSAAYEYDGQNRILKINYRNESSIIVQTTDYIYSTNAIEEKITKAGILSSRTVFQFNDKGNITGYEYYDASNRLTQRITCKTYDGKKSLKAFYEPLFTGIDHTNNNVIELESTVVSSGETNWSTYKYEYNTDGYVTKRTLKILPSGFEASSTYEYFKR